MKSLAVLSTLINLILCAVMFSQYRELKLAEYKLELADGWYVECRKSKCEAENSLYKRMYKNYTPEDCSKETKYKQY